VAVLNPHPTIADPNYPKASPNDVIMLTVLAEINPAFEYLLPAVKEKE
jgi:hypothetical protein